MIKRIFLFALFIGILTITTAQQKPVQYIVQAQTGFCGPDYVPFWLRSNQHGSIPPSGGFAGLLAGAHKEYNKGGDRKTDWGFGVSGQLYTGNPSDFTLIEVYGKIRFGIFQFKAGRSKDITGLCDTALSSGSWSISGNAPGIPNIELSVPEFYTLPVLGKMFAFKGNYLHGWMGNWYIDDEFIPGTRSYLHQKSLYGRFGKEQWRLKLYGGFNHQVIWGQEKNILGDDYTLNDFKSFIYVNLGKQYTHDSIMRTRVGNQMGSIDIGLSYDFKNIRLFVYRQNLYDAGALYSGANLLDGLNGLSIVNKRNNIHKIKWNKFLIEFLYTKNQAGETWSRYTTTPFEDYYNNYYYPAGWSYKNAVLGNPHISPTASVRSDLPANNYYNFSNNRVAVFYSGFDVMFFQLNIVGKFSWSKNYGTYTTSPDGKIYNGDNTEALYGIFPVVEQSSAYLSALLPLKNNIKISLSTAFDYGELFYNSYGIMVKIFKVF